MKKRKKKSKREKVGLKVTVSEEVQAEKLEGRDSWMEQPKNLKRGGETAFGGRNIQNPNS